MSPRRLTTTAVFAIAMAAAAPGTALAMPVIDPQPDPLTPEPVTIVREVPADGADQTLALVLSGAALLVAAGTAGYTGRSLRPRRTV